MATPFRAILSEPRLTEVVREANLDPATEKILRERALTRQMLGNRILVLRNRELDYFDRGDGVKIHKPANAVQDMQEGWVLSVGPDVGWDRDRGIPSSLSVAVGLNGGDPINTQVLLGLRVLFGRYVGGVLMLGDTDDEYKSRWLVLREEDLWCVEGVRP